jgi:hypothetical protein
MAQKPLTLEQMREAIDLVALHGNVAAAARANGLPENTLRHRYHSSLRAAERGEFGTAPVIPGFRISQVTTTPNGDFVQQRPQKGPEFEVPEGHVVKGVSALLDADGREVIKWVKTKQGELSTEAIVETLKTGFAGLKIKAPKVSVPSEADSGLLNLFTLPDLHLGLYAWGAETEANWDLDLAVETAESTVERVVSGAPRAGTAVILGGGDQLHSDNADNRTANSGHSLDVDGRFPKVLLATCRLFARLALIALTRNDQVIIRILPGNHDPHTSFALSYFLLAWFRDEPRVAVDADPSLFWWYRFGKVLLGATHGHMAKPVQMAGIMAERRAEDWGQTKFRYCHTFHVHHASKVLSEGGGVITETHQTIVPKDAWHYGMGFLSGRALQGITYHTERGEIGRNKVAIL